MGSVKEQDWSEADLRPKRSPRKPDALADICRDKDVMRWRAYRAKGGWPELTQVNAEVVASAVLQAAYVEVVWIHSALGAAVLRPKNDTHRAVAIKTLMTGEIVYEVVDGSTVPAIIACLRGARAN